MVPLSWLEIFGQMFIQFTPVWIALALIFLLSSILKRRLGLYGRLFDSPIGMLGLFIVLFWVVTALFADMIITHDPLSQVSGMKNKLPGTPVRGEEGAYYLLGGDNLARDIFSRMVMGSRFVLSIAPAATLFAFMVGVTLGFFGLGVSPESPDWGSTINDGRKLLSIYPHPALPPAFALMTLVLGLNLLADGLREESLKD